MRVLPGALVPVPIPTERPAAGSTGRRSCADEFLPNSRLDTGRVPPSVGASLTAMSAWSANAISIIGSIIIGRRPGHGNGA